VESREDWPKNIASAAAQQEMALLSENSEAKPVGGEGELASAVANASDVSSPTSDLSEIPKKPHMERSLSVGSQRLQRLREKLEYLEVQKTELAQDDESGRKSLRTRISEAFTELSKCVTDRIAHLKNRLATLSKLSEAEMKQLLANAPPLTGMAQIIGPSVGKLAVISLVNLANQKEGPDIFLNAIRYVQMEIKYLERTILAAKVMANMTLLHKKLLNLTYDWLKTYLPHCLAKINRVSYGLLSEKDMTRALQDDPMMPRSRLKLAVPFVGKDVPSESSEFAHPDIIIGLSILAYRYSSLRRNDFVVIVDAIVAEFSREIGPARERASSKRYEAWTLAAS
jgi:hypothetical protein